MPESLRARLLVWYTSILLGVMVAFGATVCLLSWQSMVARLDSELHRQAMVIGAALRPTDDDTFDLDLSFESVRYFQRQDNNGPYYVIWNDKGQLIDRSAPELDVPILAAASERSRDGLREVTVPAGGTATVLVGQETAGLEREVWRLAWLVAGTGAVALLLSLVGGWFLVRGALAPIARISRTAEAMSTGELDARIAVDRTETELGRLAQVLNQAFDRQHDAIDRQRRFTADASHELRTPLATMLLEVDWALVRDRTGAEYRDTLEACRRAAARMRGVVEGLLRLARADAGDEVLPVEPVALDDIAREVAALLRPLADARRVALAVSAEPATVAGHPELLREVVTNLVTNAIHYNRDHGHVEITVRAAGPTVTLQVIDDGIGISAEDQPRVFERFFRADKARSRDGGGSGLGLAVSQWIVSQHQGDIGCRSVLGRGSTFTVRLPSIEAAREAA